jgi:cytochrome c peroxidase
MTFPQNASAILIVIAVAMSSSLATAEPESAKKLLLTKEEIGKVIRHGPWPPPLKRDPSNRVSGNGAAIELGRAFFFDSRLSKSRKLSCASCHNPKLGWTDGLPRAVADAGKLDRNTQSLIDVRFSRWFGWDGQADNLWAQSIRPTIAPKEMNATPSHVVKVLRSDKKLSKKYTEVFGSPPNDVEPEPTLVNIGKALAAFQETLVSARTPFDTFRDALAGKDWSEAGRYPIAAQRGARIFVGRGRCNVCHFGPRFTSGEFHDAGVPYFIGPSKVDPGRHKGISLVKRSPWNLAGKYNDGATKSGAWATQQVAQLHRNFGEFKIPTLRGLTDTAPYMHNGSLPTLERVVQHYSEINIERLHADGERILRPFKLAPQEIADLVSFLKSLSPLKQ